MSTLEPIDIVINLSSSYWQDPPKAKVYIDDNLIFEDKIIESKEIKWSGDLTEDRHKLTIELFDKNKYQTIVEDGKIIKDQLLNINSISFDEIDIGFLKHSLSNYYPNKDLYVEENTPLLVKNCVNLGYNGKWELEFSTPIYIWLLENI